MKLGRIPAQLLQKGAWLLLAVQRGVDDALWETVTEFIRAGAQRSLALARH
jgi:hypothetical protein